MTVLAAWKPATAYAKSATVRPVASPGSVPVPLGNGNFEAGDTAWTKDAGWAISTGAAYEGTYKAIYTGTGSGTIKSSGTYTATAGQVITTTIKAKVLDVADGATAFLKWYNASNVLISTTTGLESSVESGVWMQLSVVGLAPVNAAFVVFGVEATRTVGASVTLDDARWDYTAPIQARRLAYRAVQDVAGVSGAVEPNWPTVLGARIVDGTVTWETIEVSWIEWTAKPIIESGLTEPVWPTTVGAYVQDGTTNWECTSRRVEDEKCPQSKVVAIMSSKVFAADKDIVRYCATANPLDWSTAQDAGYLPTGLQQANANDMAVLYPFRGNLCAWNASSFQMWQTDPDPTQMSLLDQMDGVGSTFTLAARAVGNDLYYLSNYGVRSVGIANAAENLQAGDVGMPIDVLVQAAMAQAVIDEKKAISTYWPGMGQYWLCFGDDGVTAGAGGALRLICAPPNPSLGVEYSYTYTVTGGTPPYMFFVVSGSLPDGLTLNATTGILSGTPTVEGSFSFGIQVIDAKDVGAFCGWSATVVETTVDVTDVPRWLGTGSTAAGIKACSRPLSYSGEWIGAGDAIVSDLINTVVCDAHRLGDYMVAFITKDTHEVQSIRIANINALDTWTDGAMAPAYSVACAVSGSRLFTFRDYTDTIHYIDSPTAPAFTTGFTFPTVFNNPVVIALAGNGTNVVTVSGYGQMWGSSDNGSTFTVGALLFYPGRFYVSLAAMDVNGSRFVIGGHNDSGIAAYYTDDVGVTATACSFPSGPFTLAPMQVKYCGGGNWLMALTGAESLDSDGLVLSTDNAVTFLPVDLPVRLYFNQQSNRSIAVDAISGRVAILGNEYGTNTPRCFTTDDFVTWEEIDLAPTQASIGISEIYPL